MAVGKAWQRNEQMLALELYCRTPFGRISKRNSDIIALSKKLGRTPSSVSLKMANFSALDPTIKQRGMGNYSKSDALIWEEFFDNPTAFLDGVASVMETLDLKEYAQETSRHAITEMEWETREGINVPVVTTRRKHQSFFRKTLLAAYGGCCGVTKIAQPELLIASHIKPWAEDEKNRLNPRNGILLNSLHDRAFDSGLISFEDNLDIIVSKNLHLHDMARPFFENQKLHTPEKFSPDPAFLMFHREHKFQSLNSSL